MSNALFQSDIPGYSCRRGKVRDVYDLGDRLLIVATDRISAFDYILSTPIPGKGRILTALSLFWFRTLGIKNHVISTELKDYPPAFQTEQLAGRSMLVHKCEVVPFECVVRGYLAGSGWKDYQKTGAVCGVHLPAGLRESEQLPEAIFTPATKAESGHDENVSFAEMAKVVSEPLATELKTRSLDVYHRAAVMAKAKGVIIADTKFEWGRLPDGELILIDEVLTPDSSRFWPGDDYAPGRGQSSYDKQYVRDWLETSGWDKNSTPPELPAEVVAKSREKYLEALIRIAGKSLDS
ncbi:phosphoribosylaminoimidazolesuccinocarboxamide synthase [Zavarzinella formosa]|uniref:phosphoribosylaminoimidazolesuccinocarboxamide synthase n=1 Tax=Zavarzinella formosa TaxID=360055 RepID=UPI0012F908B9|nr:phosphoribosylaminoimidazolesuccinocarboxamide synthase [Zavarzinella formosa]